MSILKTIDALLGRNAEPIVPVSTTRIVIAKADRAGAVYPDEARFDLFIDDMRAGYALEVTTLKQQISDHLDSEMRDVGGYGPEPRRSLEESIAESERLRALRHPGGCYAHVDRMDADDLSLLLSRIRRMIQAVRTWPVSEGQQVLGKTASYARPEGSEEPYAVLTTTVHDTRMIVAMANDGLGTSIRIYDDARRGEASGGEERRVQDLKALEHMLEHLRNPFRSAGDTGNLRSWRAAVEKASSTVMAVISSTGQKPLQFSMKLPYASVPFSVDDGPRFFEPHMDAAIGELAPSTMTVSTDRNGGATEYMMKDSTELPDEDALDLHYGTDRWIDGVETLRSLRNVEDVPRPWTRFIAERGDV